MIATSISTARRVRTCLGSLRGRFVRVALACALAGPLCEQPLSGQSQTAANEEPSAAFDDPGLAGAQGAWKRIVGMAAPDPDERDAFESQLADAARSLRPHALVASPRRLADWYVTEFGVHGDVVDLRWLAAIPEAAAVVGGGQEWGLQPKTDNKQKDWRALQLETARAIVTRALHKPEWRARYCRAAGWFSAEMRSGQIRYPLGVSLQHLDFSDETCWWHYRHLMVLMELTGRGDLLADARPADMRERVERWVSWLAEQGPFLRSVGGKEFGWRVDAGEKMREEAFYPFVNGEGRLPELPWRSVPPFVGSNLSLALQAMDAVQ